MQADAAGGGGAALKSGQNVFAELVGKILYRGAMRESEVYEHSLPHLYAIVEQFSRERCFDLGVDPDGGGTPVTKAGIAFGV